MWVKVKRTDYADNNTRYVTRGKYYKVVGDYQDSYIVKDDCGDSLLLDKKYYYEPITHVKCVDNTGFEHTLTLDRVYEIENLSYDSANNLLVRIRDDGHVGGYNSDRFEFVTGRVISLGDIAEPLELHVSEDEVYCITYSIDFGRGVELKELTSSQLLEIEGAVVSTGRTWVIETEHGTVIIPFKSIVHAYPKY